MDPPEHATYRRIVSTHFTPRVRERFDARYGELVERLGYAPA